MGFIPSVRTDLVEKREQVFDLLSFFWRRHPDLNWGIKVLQTSALPLGYGAIFLRFRELNLVGADYGARTRHLDLGKVALYQMS